MNPTRSLAKTISKIEARDPATLRSLAALYHSQSFAKTVCFTGPGGVGKSTLISELAPLRASARKLAWLACDPSSPETGGALLGDRIRISGKEIDERLFIRSLSTRGASATPRAIRDIEVCLDELFDEIWVETAGSGQTQSDVARISALTVLVLQPETGDDVQWMKSGLRDWSDLFVIHKSDLPGAETMRQSLVEEGISEDRIFMVSSLKRVGHSEFLTGVDKAKAKISARKLQTLQEWHARELFLESAMRKASVEFKKTRVKWVKSPYASLK